MVATKSKSLALRCLEFSFNDYSGLEVAWLDQKDDSGGHDSAW